MFHAEFKSINGNDSYPLSQIIYRGADGSLLEVSHDRSAWNARSATEWKDLFTSRRLSFAPADLSGVWSKRELVLPEIPEEDIITLQEGWSPLFNAQKLAEEIGVKSLHVKLCGNSHTGSFKDLGMTVLVSHVNHLIKNNAPIKAVACASTGDTSAALSAFCAKAGIPSIVFLPAGKISVAQLVQPISNGSIVLALDTDFDGCMKIVQEVTAVQSIYLANSMNSLRIEGQKTISYELCQEMNWSLPDPLIIPGGNLGNVSALAKGIDDLLALGIINKKPRIIVAQAENANPFYQAYKRNFDKLEPVQAKKTLASAIQIGNPVSYPKAETAIKNYNGIVEQVSEQELADAAHRADKTGLYCCPHTGVALGALFKLREKNIISSDEKVVVISTAHGLKFSEFKIGYHEQTLPDISPKYANAIHKLPAKADAVMDVLNKFIFTMLLCFITSLNVYANDSLHSEAQKLYSKGNFEAAAKMYANSCASKTNKACQFNEIKALSETGKLDLVAEAEKKILALIGKTEPNDSLYLPLMAQDSKLQIMLNQKELAVRSWNLAQESASSDYFSELYAICSDINSAFNAGLVCDKVKPADTSLVSLQRKKVVPLQAGKPEQVANQQGKFYIQLGAFGVKANAEKLLNEYKSKGAELYITEIPDRNLFAVRGNFVSKGDAEAFAKKMSLEKYTIISF